MSDEMYQREKAARKKAENLLESMSKELFQSNEKLKNKNKILKFKNDALGLLMVLIEYVQKDDTDLNDSLKKYLNEVCKFCKWPIGHIYFLDHEIKQNNPNDEYIVPSDIWFIENEEKYKLFVEKTMMTSFKVGEGLPGKVVEKSEPVSVHNLAVQNFYEIIPFARIDVCQKVELKNAFAVPLFHEGEIFAIAEFFSGIEQPDRKQYLNFVINSASHINTVLERKISEKTLKTKNIELEKALAEIKQIQMQLTHSSKMASLGQLAAGVAHEINNPIAYLESNLRVLKKYVQFYNGVRESRQQFFDKVLNQFSGDLNEKEKYDKDSEKIGIVLEDIDNLATESLEGVRRVSEIVSGLKSFARLNEAEYKEANVNDCIESTLKMMWNELKYKCELKKEFSELPAIKCNAGQLNQVFMNLLVNASHAIETKGLITIKTFLNKSDICISISDTGRGIPKENINSIFEPFFTTKPVGVGTGLGLSISYGIIQKHGGKIEVQSEPGAGTTFLVSLPLEPKEASKT